MPTYANTIDGNEILAKRSQCDYAGNDIQTTYATKTEVTTGLASKEDSSNKAQSINANSTTDFPSSKATADFVNSSVATNTAKFLGNFTLTDLSLTYPATDAQIETALDGYTFSPAPTNNDYVYVEIQDPQTPGVTDVVKRFKFDGANWLYEYSLNNSSFTAAEIAAIDSGITSTKVGNYDTHIADTTIHVTSTDKSTWNAKQDAISDLATIRSGAQSGATAVQPGDLSTVATTGDYSDLTGTPTIPTATSDLTNDSGFITLSDVPAQVNADWNSSSGASEILNKPTIPSGTQLVPAATSADADKVLTVNAQGTPAWANAQAPISAGNGIDITNNVVSAKVDGTTITTNGSGELAVVNGGQSTASSFFTPAYGKSADGSLSTARLGPSLHTRYTAFNTYGLALEGYNINSSISVLGRRPDVRLANFIQPNGKIIFMYGASTWNASWYPVWFPCNHRNDSAGYIDVIDPTVYLKAKSPVTFTWQGTEGQSIYNSDGTYNTNFNSSNRYSFSVTAPLSTGYNVDADTYDMIGDWTSITTPPLDEWVLAFWDGNNNTWMNIGGSTEANSHIAVKWNTSSLDVKVMSGGGLDINIGAGLYVTNPLPTSSSSDEGKVLTVNSSGSAEWGNASTVTVDQTYDGTSTNAQSGTAVAGAIATKEDAFDVGTGLEMDTSGATPTLQVEAPVDIVAGPGIVIDNPDGNTLRVSVAQDVEVVLYSNNGAAQLPQSTVTLSENASNFEKVVVMYRDRFNNITNSTTFYTDNLTFGGEPTSRIFLSAPFLYESANPILARCSQYKFTAGNTLTFESCGNMLYTTTGVTCSYYTAANNQGTFIYKVVGVHRIAGGN